MRVPRSESYLLLPFLLCGGISVGSVPVVKAGEPCQRALHGLRSASPGQVIRELEALPAATAQDLPCLAALAQAHFALGRHEEASTLYEACTRLSPGHADLHFNLGLSRLKTAQVVLGAYMVRQDQARAAEAAFRQACALQPEEPRHRHHVGLSLELRQDNAAALVEYARALKIDPSHGPSHIRSGVLLLQDGDARGAVLALQQGLKFLPRDGDAAYHLGKAYLRVGRPEEAVEVLTLAIAIRPSSSEAHFNLARALAQLGREDEATAVRQRFETLGTSGLDSASAELAAMAGEGRGLRDHRFHYTLGVRHEREGRLDEALKAYRRALELAPELASLQLRAGIVLAQLGQLDAAEVHVREALRLNPATPSAAAVLDLILRKTGRSSDPASLRGGRP